MKKTIIFLINPVLYILYKASNYKKFLREKKEVLFALSLSILNTYIPYNAGDSVRYAFKYYELMLFPINEAWSNYLPHQDYLYYGVLFLFSRLKIPYHIFVIFTSFIMFYIILYLINKNDNTKNKMIYFILLYMPINIALSIRFPLANYIVIFSFFQKNFIKKGILLTCALLIHKASLVIILLYFINKYLHYFIKKINIKFIAFFLIIIFNFIYLNLDIIYNYFPNVYIIKNIYIYSQINFDEAFTNVIFSKLGFINLFIFISFVSSYLYLFSIKTKKLKEREYNFLIILGCTIFSFCRIGDIAFRFCWIYNIFFVKFLMENNNKSNIFLLLYNTLIKIHAFLSLSIILYYSSFFYIERYRDFPQLVFPTIMQIVGINNKYNEKIKRIANEYPEKEILGRSVMANLSKYYNKEN